MQNNKLFNNIIYNNLKESVVIASYRKYEKKEICL